MHSCLVVKLNGLDGAMGMPTPMLAHVEGAAHLEDLDPVHQLYAKWAPALVPHTRLHRVAEKIHDQLSSSSPDSETIVCLHARISSCTDRVIAEGILDPAQMELALLTAEKHMSAAMWDLGNSWENTEPFKVCVPCACPLPKLPKLPILPSYRSYQTHLIISYILNC